MEVSGGRRSESDSDFAVVLLRERGVGGGGNGEAPADVTVECAAEIERGLAEDRVAELRHELDSYPWSSHHGRHFCFPSKSVFAIFAYLSSGECRITGNDPLSFNTMRFDG